MLQAGVDYFIRVTGSVTIDSLRGLTADAEYAHSLGEPPYDGPYDKRPTHSLVDYGLGIDDPVPDTVKPPHWDGDGDGMPNPDGAGGYAYGLHWAGRGASHVFSFHDDKYDDNYGYLTVQIYAPPAQVSISATDPEATEPTSDAAPSDDEGTLRITRTGDQTQPLDVYFDVDAAVANSAIAGVDYTDFPGRLSPSGHRYKATIPAQTAFIDLQVTPEFDGVAEGDEKVKAVLAPDQGQPTGSPPRYTVGSPTFAEVTIKDAPPGPPPRNISDQVGPDFNQRVDIHGVPLPDPSPTGEGEGDRIPNMAYVDAYHLTPSFSTTDVAVPMPGGELVMEFRRTMMLDQRILDTNPDTAFYTNAQWDSETILGMGWRSNLGSRVVVSTNPSHEPGDPETTATVVDEVGNGISYIQGAGGFIPDVRFSFSNLAVRGKLVAGDSTYPLVYEKTHGTKLYFQLVGTKQRGPGPSSPFDKYYRLAKIVDRNGNELHFGYGAGDGTVVTRIFDPAVSGREIQFGYDNGRLSTVTDPLGRTHTYTFTNGLLTSVLKPSPSLTDITPPVSFGYEVDVAPRVLYGSTLPEPEYPGEVVTVKPTRITDARGHNTVFTYDNRIVPTSYAKKTALLF